MHIMRPASTGCRSCVLVMAIRYPVASSGSRKLQCLLQHTVRVLSWRVFSLRLLRTHTTSSVTIHSMLYLMILHRRRIPDQPQHSARWCDWRSWGSSHLAPRPFSAMLDPAPNLAPGATAAAKAAALRPRFSGFHHHHHQSTTAKQRPLPQAEVIVVHDVPYRAAAALRICSADRDAYSPKMRGVRRTQTVRRRAGRHHRWAVHGNSDITFLSRISFSFSLAFSTSSTTTKLFCSIA